MRKIARRVTRRVTSEASEPPPTGAANPLYGVVGADQIGVVLVGTLISPQATRAPPPPSGCG